MENEIPVQSINQLLLQHINEAALFTNASFVITAYNKAAARLFQFPLQDLSGLDISSLFSKTPVLSRHKVTVMRLARFLLIERAASPQALPAIGPLRCYADRRGVVLTGVPCYT